MHKEYFAGCDIGSTTGKAVILDKHGIVGSAIIPGEIDPEDTARIVLQKACEQVKDQPQISDLTYLIGTGYGRKVISFAKENISEISCHALGVYQCDAAIHTIIDIGGQDIKGVAIGKDGTVLEFVMNDKCAAGTGRFFEMMSRTFKMDLDEFSRLSLDARHALPITSQCSVFAETEVISLLAKRHPPSDIAAGIQSSVSKRCFALLKKVGIKPKVAVTGGCAKNKGLIKALQHRLRMDIETLSVDPQLMGAYGAAISARKKVLG